MKKITLLIGALLLGNSFSHSEAAAMMLNKSSELQFDKELLQAATDGKIDKVKEILSKKDLFDLHYGDKIGNTALHVACRNGHTKIAVLLLDFAEKNKVQGCVKFEGFDIAGKPKSITKYINFKNAHSMTAFHEAVYNGHEETARLLLERGAHSIIHAHFNPLYAGPRCYGRPLHVAVQGGRLNCVKMLLTQGADVHFKDILGRTPLHYAAMGGHTEIYNLLCEHEAYENEQDKDGYLPGHYAALEGHTSFVRSFSKGPFDVNKRDGKGRTFLQCAVKKGHRKTVSALLEYDDIELNASDGEQKTALYYAFERRDIATIKMLIEKGAEMCGNVVDYLKLDEGKQKRLFETDRLVQSVLSRAQIEVLDTDSKRWKALIHATQNNDKPAVQLLVENALLKSKFVFGVSNNDTTFFLDLTKKLCAAVKNKNRPLVEFLLEAGAQLVQDVNSKSALTDAVDSSDIDMIRLLLEKASPFNRKPSFADVVDGRLKLVKDDFLAIVQYELYNVVSKKDCTVETVELFVKARADLHKPRKLGYIGLANRPTLLHEVACSGNSVIAKYLIDKGLPLEAKAFVEGLSSSLYDSTALHVAVVSGNTAVAKTLLAAGAQSNIKDYSQRSLVHAAALAGNAQLCEVLIAANVTVNSLDHIGWTPLKCALYCENKEKSDAVCAVLINNGANFNGDDLMEEAAQHNNPGVIKILLGKGFSRDGVKGTGLNPLEWSLCRGHFEATDAFLEGLTPIEKDRMLMNCGYHYERVFRYAGRIGNLAILENLLRIRSFDNAIGNVVGPDSALIEAYKAGQENAVDWLLSKDVNINWQGVNGWTILHHAANRNDFAMVQRLLRRGAHYDLKTSDTFNDTAFHRALKNDNFKCIDEFIKIIHVDLLDRSCQIDRNLWFRYYAYAGANSAVLNLLATVDVDTRGPNATNGDTPLILAVKADKREIVDLLLGHKANISLADKNDNTPLHHAAKLGSHAMVKLLVEHNADVFQKNSEGKDAYKIAQETESKDKERILELLSK